VVVMRAIDPLAKGATLAVLGLGRRAWVAGALSKVGRRVQVLLSRIGMRPRQ